MLVQETSRPKSDKKHPCCEKVFINGAPEIGDVTLMTEIFGEEASASAFPTTTHIMRPAAFFFVWRGVLLMCPGGKTTGR